MATLILSTVGSAIGGPIGGLIGATIGQRLDSALFGPKGRSGPRLSDLAVQTSSYGNPVPKLFGRMRVAGTVIWATNLVESRKKVSTGKGQPKATVYSYTANFAVALSARRAGRIGRIWADGKLLRGEAGDFKTPARFRFYAGDEGQTIDPLIASVEGIANCPAYRGLAYAVFEDFQLGDYGNRIPSLSFEVIADEGDVSVARIVSELAGPAVRAISPTLFGGFSAIGERVRAALEVIGEVVALSASDDGEYLTISEAPGALRSVDATDLGVEGSARIERNRLSDMLLPHRRSISFFDSARDFQAGSQSARRGSGQREDRFSLPATLGAEQARSLAETGLAGAWDAANKVAVFLPWRYLDVKPGLRLGVPGLDGEWVVTSAHCETMVVRCELRPVSSSLSMAIAADPGRNTPQPDIEQGPTVVHIVDLPLLRDGVATSPQTFVVAAGSSPGWRQAALMLSSDQGSSWTEIGTTAAPAILGAALNPLAPGATWGVDQKSWADVELLHAGMDLTDADMNGLLAGRNLALLGHELIQFMSAQQLGATRWRLSGLLRGRRGTEWAMNAHAVGDTFVLIESDALLHLPLEAGVAEARVLASGVGDIVPATAIATEFGSALLPPAPAHVATETVASDMHFSWIRRSRDGWRWVDGADAPLAEETERYRIELLLSNGTSRVAETLVPEWQYAQATRLADLGAGATSATLAIRQLGTHGASRAATIAFNL